VYTPQCISAPHPKLKGGRIARKHSLLARRAVCARDAQVTVLLVFHILFVLHLFVPSCSSPFTLDANITRKEQQAEPKSQLLGTTNKYLRRTRTGAEGNVSADTRYRGLLMCPFTTAQAHKLAPTEVRCEFFKSSFFVVAVFLWSNRVIIRINMHQRRPETPTWSLGGGVKDEKNIFFLSLMFYETNISI
jgi:hypothetical protein